MASNSKLEDLNLTQDELKRIKDAFKDEKFRQLFCEYAQEISDPENRRRYEEEIAQMERERGMDVAFVRPEPGYVLKTSVNGDKKAFINISKSDTIDKPSSERKISADGKIGLMWHIPHSFAPPREDHDKQKNRCMVYDFVIHPDTYRMAESNAKFSKVVEETAMDGIEKQFQVKLDRKNLKRPKLKFKGVPSATVIRTRSASGATAVPDSSGIMKDMPYPYDNKTTLEKMKEREQNLAKKQEMNQEQVKEGKTKDEATSPKYTIIHRSEIDMQEYRNAPDAKPCTRPRELVIKIELPLLQSAGQANLDIFEKRLCLESGPPTVYKLDLNLPYPVDDSKGSAKFDKQKRTLVVTLPVVPGDTPTMPSFISDKTAGSSGSEENNGISSELNVSEGIPDDKPLIEVLSNETDSNTEDAGTTGQEELLKEKRYTEPHSVSSGDDEMHISAAVNYSLPDFSFTQNTETVTFLLKVKNVTENSIKHVSPSNHEVDFVCTSYGSGGFPFHFRLYLRFAESCMIVPEHCRVDVADDNVVLLLLKDLGSQGLWDQFWAGLQSNNLEKRLFLTTSNLQQQMEELAESSPDMGQLPVQPEVPTAQDLPCSLEVTSMNSKKLTIKICPPGKQQSKKSNSKEGEEETAGGAEDNDMLLSSKIEGVHSHPSNSSLQGILKQLSDEAGQDTSMHSSIDDDDLSPTSPGKRCMVSFSEHIDKATFKASASVSSMKTALKSKRKRQHRFEERKNNSFRRGHNSTGSEGSLSHSEEGGMGVESGDWEMSPEEESGGEADADAACRVLDFRTKSDRPSRSWGMGNGDSDPRESDSLKADRDEDDVDGEEDGPEQVVCHGDRDENAVEGEEDGSGQGGGSGDRDENAVDGEEVEGEEDISQQGGCSGYRDENAVDREEDVSQQGGCSGDKEGDECSEGSDHSGSNSGDEEGREEADYHGSSGTDAEGSIAETHHSVAQGNSVEGPTEGPIITGSSVEGPTGAGSCNEGPTEGSTVIGSFKEGPTEGSIAGPTEAGSNMQGSSITNKIRSKLVEGTIEIPRDDSDDDDGDAEGREGNSSPQSKLPSHGHNSSAEKSYNEHRTECAFQFSNSVMFDLDVD